MIGFYFDATSILTVAENHYAKSGRGRSPLERQLKIASVRLRLRFKNQIERRLGRAAEAGKAAAEHDFAQPRLACLRA